MLEKLKIYFTNEAGAINTLGKVALVLLYFIIAILVVKVIGLAISRLARKKYDKLRTIDAKRLKTVLSVLKSFATVIIIFTWFLSALRIFGVNTSAIVTTAGIGGVAISFGAKSLVEDIISGIFLMLKIALLSATTSQSLERPEMSRKSAFVRQPSVIITVNCT